MRVTVLIITFLAAILVTACGEPSQTNTVRDPIQTVDTKPTSPMMASTNNPSPVSSGLQEHLSPVPTSIPEHAMTTLRDFMGYRLRRDEQHALLYLAPELRKNIQYQQLLPVSSPRWLTYTVISAQQPVAKVVSVKIQIAYAAKPIGTEVGGFIEQDIRLEQQDDHWLVVSLGEQKVSSQTAQTKVDQTGSSHTPIPKK